MTSSRTSLALCGQRCSDSRPSRASGPWWPSRTHRLRRCPAFRLGQDVASYAGLVPSPYQSGDCDRHGHITKRGSAELRTMLCEVAHHARRAAHPLHPYFLKLCARRGYKIAIVAVAHRLCRLLYALLRDGTDFQPSRLGVEEGPFTQTVTRRFGLTPKPAGRLAV